MLTLAPISPELFADFKAGKENALETFFRANFDALTADANAKLEDPGAAQKAAASAILDVWERRAKLNSAGEMAELTIKALGGETAHEQRRRAAAHHMGGGHAKAHEPAPAESVDAWWNRSKSVLSSAPADHEAAVRARAESSRHEAAAHMAKVAEPKRTGMFVVIGLVLLVGAAVPLWYLNKGAETTKAMQLLNKDDAHVTATKEGQRGTVKLEDGTEVKLGAKTVLKYSKSYPLDAHAIQLIGTAHLKAPKTDSPLLVRAGNVWLYISEGEALVRSFADDSNTVMLKVLGGSVNVKYEKTEKDVAAGQSLLILANGTFMDLAPERAEFAFAWNDNIFKSDNQPLRKVLVEFKKWYGVDISTKDSSFLERPVSMTASLDSLKVAFKALEDGGAIKISLTSETKATMADNAANAQKAKKGK